MSSSAAAAADSNNANGSSTHSSMYVSPSRRGKGSPLSVENPLSLSLSDHSVWEWYQHEAGKRDYHKRGGKQAIQNYENGPRLSALTVEDLNRPAAAWVDFLHNSTSSSSKATSADTSIRLRGSYSFPWSSGEAARRLNENGAVYLRNYLYVVACCGIGVLYKRLQALLGLIFVALIYLFGKKFGPSIKSRSEWLFQATSTIAQIAIWLILSFSTATAVVAYAIVVGGAGELCYSLTFLSPPNSKFFD